MDLNRSELLEIGLDALQARPADLPSAMDARILDAVAARSRPTLHPGWDGAELSSYDAFVRTAAELGRLLNTLSPEDWAQTTRVGGGASVRDLVQHLVGVERYLLGQLGRAVPIDAPRPEDHFPVLRRAASDLDGVSDAEVARAWWLGVTALIGACGELGPDHPLACHHLAGSVRSTLVTRTFELWTHDDDIRRAVGLPANELDHARLALMSTALIESLSIGMALSGTTQRDRTVHIELTGSGGGSSFDTALSPGDTPGAPDLTIVTSALDLCRLAANRLTVEQIEVVVDGDRSLLEPVLVGASAFALD